MEKLPQIYTYDLETFKNCFLFIGKFESSPDCQVFEISARKNDRDDLMKFINYLKNLGVLMQGFNNLGFDYHIVDMLLKNNVITYYDIYLKSQEIINDNGYAGGEQKIYPIHWKEREIPQVDLVKINHFDNKNRSTRLKDLEIAMRSEFVEDLPYSPHEDLTSEQMDKLIAYGCHDVRETEKFGLICRNLIEMRWDLLQSGVITGDVLNYSDVKIGEKYLVTKIGRNKCYRGSRPIQTHEHSITHFKDVVLPKIVFRTDECNEVLNWFMNTTVNIHAETKPSFTKVIGGVEFDFGLGGVHASVHRKRFYSNDEYVIKDVDVSGMYVAVAIANGFAPKHLGQDFSVVYKQLQSDRKQYKKGTTMNATLKLAGNGVYGKSNDTFSPFYDPRYTFTVTSNGQLQLLQLVEMFLMIPGLQLIQANTDGITAYVPRQYEWLFECYKIAWEKETGLQLEEVTYKSMFIRDVNNYIAVYDNGKVKRKGAYAYPESIKDYEGYWNKDYSSMVVPKITSLCMIYGLDPEEVIKTWSDKFDFMIREKAKGRTIIKVGDQQVTKTVRFYASTAGQQMVKVAPPTGEMGSYKRRSGLKDSEYNAILKTIPEGTWDKRIHTKNKSKHDIRENKVLSGFNVKVCNDANNFNWADLDYKYYVEEIKKILI